KDYSGILLSSATHLGCLITVWDHIGQQQRVVQILSLWDDCRPDIGIRYALIFCLTAIVATGSVGVSVNSINSSSHWIGFVAGTKQTLSAKYTFVAGNIKRYQ